MLENSFIDVYTKFKLQFYSVIFQRFEKKEQALSALEIFCIEVIQALKHPTVREFAEFAKISAPNATYKINNLIKKGYIQKVQNKEDKRQYYLSVTEKYADYHIVTYDYIKVVMNRIKEHFPKEDVNKLDSILATISAELMNEVQVKNIPPFLN